MKPDRWGRFLTQTTDVLFGIYQKGERLRLKDGTTGKWLLTAKETDVALQQANEQVQEEARNRINAEIQAQEEATRAITEAKARLDAEMRAQ